MSSANRRCTALAVRGGCKAGAMTMSRGGGLGVRALGRRLLLSMRVARMAYYFVLQSDPWIVAEYLQQCKVLCNTELMKKGCLVRAGWIQPPGLTSAAAPRELLRLPGDSPASNVWDNGHACLYGHRHKSHARSSQDHVLPARDAGRVIAV